MDMPPLISVTGVDGLIVAVGLLVSAVTATIKLLLSQRHQLRSEKFKIEIGNKKFELSVKAREALDDFVKNLLDESDAPELPESSPDREEKNK